MYAKHAWLGTVLVGLAVIAAFSHTARAQQPNTVLTGMEANGNQLRKYTFKQRTEIYHKGELKNAKTDEIHHAATGELVAIPLDEQKADQEPRRRGPGSRIVGKKIKEEQEKMKEYIDRLMSLTSRYLAPDPEKLRSAIGDAWIAVGGGGRRSKCA
jgi:vacuolar-type H+-ATPase subunit I/STV1